MPNTASNRMPERLLLLLALLAPGWAAAERVTYCCQDDTGHQTCGDVLPPQCYNKAYRVLGSKGLTLRRVETPLTPEQRAQREADAQRKQSEERTAREQRRRDMALLETYASDKDIDAMRDRALRAHEQSLRELQTRRVDLQKKQKAYASEAEFYTKKPMPPELRNAIKDTDAELQGLDAQVAVRQKDADATRARFDDEKQRFLDIKHRGATNAAASAGR